MRGQIFALAAVVAALALPSIAQAAPPPNDAYATAEVVAGPSGTVFGSRVDATSESDEPTSMPHAHSIWYAWTAPAYGTLSFDTAGTAWAWVFTGDAPSVDTMKINGQRYGFLSVRPGVTYRFGLDDWTDGGLAQLSWNFAELPPPPANDDWANAQPLGDVAATVDVDTLPATREPCDPYLGGGHSLWFSWVAPADGELTVQGLTSARGTIAAVYTGDSLCSLEERAWSGGDPSIANVVAGQTYWLAVDTWTDGGGPTSFRYSFETVTRPANDNFENAAPLGLAYRGSVSGFALHATAQPGEGTPYGSHTLWYSWTPAESGQAVVDIGLADGVVFSGDSLASLTRIAYQDEYFHVDAGTTYFIQIAGTDYYTLEWLLEPDRPPLNDAFANAQPLGGDAGSVSATNRLATFEEGEPDHGGTSHASVWFSWTAPVAGTTTFSINSSFWTIAQAYVGSKVTSLVAVDTVRDVEAQRISFAAVPGTTYEIAVDGRAGGAGLFDLAWSTEPSVSAEPHPPVAQPDSFTTKEDVALKVPVSKLLANDSDPDGDALSLSGLSTDKKSHGSVKLVKDVILFTPDRDYNGTGRFTYRVSDPGGLEATGFATVKIVSVNDAPTVTLTAADAQFGEGASTVLSAVPNDVDGDPVTLDWSASVGTLEVDGSTAKLSVDDGPAVSTVQVVASDGVESTTATQDVVVANVEPSVDAAPVSGVWGLPVSFTGTASDPSAADTAAGLAPTWTFDGSALSSLTAQRVYDVPGSYAATFTATDKDGGSSSRAVGVQIGNRDATLVYTGPASAPFGFGALAARLGDAADAASARLDGHAVTFSAGAATFGGSTVGGVATANVGGALLPGTYAVGVRFGGDGLYNATSAAGTLNVVNSAGKVSGGGKLADGTPFSLSVAGDGTTVQGSLTVGSFAVASVTALGLSGGTGWFAGTGTDGTPFVAQIIDAGEPGGGVDVLRLWIGGAQHAGSGTIAAGNLQIHR